MKRTSYFLTLIVLLSCGQVHDNDSSESQEVVLAQQKSSVPLTSAQEITHNTKSHKFTPEELSALGSIEYFKEDKSIPFRELRKIKDLNLGDSCLVAVLDLLTLNYTDTTVYLVNLCSSVRLGTLANKSTPPGGVIITTSLISSDTIRTTIKNGYVGDYVPDEYYEELSDSIIIISKIVDGRMLVISRDSTRTTRKISL